MKKARFNLRDIERHLTEHSNHDKTIHELAEIFNYHPQTMRKKCQQLVIDEKSHVALLVYQRQVKTKKGKYIYRLCGGYCVIDPETTTDVFYAKIDDTISWAHALGASVKKLVWKSFMKEANKKVLLVKQQKEIKAIAGGITATR